MRERERGTNKAWRKETLAVWLSDGLIPQSEKKARSNKSTRTSDTERAGEGRKQDKIGGEMRRINKSLVCHPAPGQN